MSAAADVRPALIGHLKDLHLTTVRECCAVGYSANRLLAQKAAEQRRSLTFWRQWSNLPWAGHAPVAEEESQGLRLPVTRNFMKIVLRNPPLLLLVLAIISNLNLTKSRAGTGNRATEQRDPATDSGGSGTI